MIAGVLAGGWLVIQIAAFLFILWLGWRYFDKRYKQNPKGSDTAILSGALEKTAEVFIDPKDGLKYRVYYNRRTGERTYIQED